jgi:cytochrome c biogenesis protein CcmG/thiol:disulfide interchange protein DsbE
MLRSLLPLGLFLLIGLALAVGLTKDPRNLPSVMIDRPFPEFELAELYDEAEILTAEMFKGQVSLINVFGSWCVSCNLEHPVLIDIAKSGEAVLIGMDWRDERIKAKRWLAQLGNPYAKVIFDDESILAIKLGVTGAPESFIADKAGNIRYKYTGVITPEIWQKELRPIIKSLQAE